MTLLERWAKAEPERVRIDSDGRNARINSGTGFGIIIHPDSMLTDPKVLGFVVSAIEVRGWEFELDHMGYTDTDTPRRFDAHVWTESGDVYPTGPRHGHPTASEALLTAYLDAVEGEG